MGHIVLAATAEGRGTCWIANCDAADRPQPSSLEPLVRRIR